MVLAAAIDQSLSAPTELGGFDLADEDRVVSGVVLRDRAALEPGEGAFDQRSACAVAHVDPVPEGDRRYPAACEVLRDRSLVSSKEACGPPFCTVKRLVR